MVTASGLGVVVQNAVYGLIAILHNGQSLCTGDYGDPPVTTTQPYNNKQLHDSSGNYNNAGSGTWSQIALIAPVRAEKYAGGGADVNPYPTNIGGETAEITACNTVTHLSITAGNHWNLIAGNYGQGGASYTVIEKGGSGNAYASMQLESSVLQGMSIANLFFGAALLTHGEADAALASNTYLAFLESYQADIQADFKPYSGQSTAIPLIISQQNSFPFSTGATPYNFSALAQVSAAQNGTAVLSGPKYYLPFYTDRAHLTNTGYRLLGEKYGQVLFALLSGSNWNSFVPTAGTLSGNTATITFQAPVLPLQWSSAFTSPHLSGTYAAWANGKGFEAWSGGVGGSIVTINSVTIQNNNQVKIVCASAPDTIAYAHTPDVTASYTGGFPDGRCGLLTDSDPFVGPYTSTAQPNWLCECVIVV